MKGTGGAILFEALESYCGMHEMLYVSWASLVLHFLCTPWRQRLMTHVSAQDRDPDISQTSRDPAVKE